MKRNPNWRSLYIVSVGLVVLTLAASLSLRGALPDGLAQRIGNAFFWAWFVVMSLKLVSLGTHETGVPALSGRASSMRRPYFDRTLSEMTRAAVPAVMAAVAILDKSVVSTWSICLAGQIMYST